MRHYLFICLRLETAAGMRLLSKALGIAAVAAAYVAGAGTIYVDYAATGNNNGTSWTDAFTTITQGISSATGGDDLWIAQGVYYPGAARADSFLLKHGVALYGGFTSGAAWSNRDYTNNIVIMSGEVQQDAIPTNNAYHVAWAVTVSNVVLDGLTIQAGYADQPDPHDKGAGLFISNALVTVSNVIFCDNVATQAGGGIYNDLSSRLVGENSTFRSNNAGASGGGIYNYGSAASPTCRLDRCVFVANHAHGPYIGAGGGAIYNTQRPLVVSNCVFSNNVAPDLGGAIYAFGGACDVTIAGSTFGANSVTNLSGSSHYGGAIFLYAARSLTMRNSTLTMNMSTYYGGALSGWSLGAGIIENCVFTTNYCTQNGRGAAIHMTGSGGALDVSNCQFVANSAYNAAVYNYSGGALKLRIADSLFCDNYGDGEAAIYNAAGKTGVVVNTVFCGNRSGNYGALHNLGYMFMSNCLVAGNLGAFGVYYTAGALKNEGTSIVVNCTFADNKATGRGGAIHSGHTGAGNALFITNSIFWENRASMTGDEVYVTNCVLIVGYTDIKGGLSGPGVVAYTSIVNDTGGNINTNPLFPDPATGQWTANAVYYPSLVQTALTNANASWQAGELVGRFLNPNTNSVVQQYYIYTNGTKSITVWGNATTGGINSAYAIYDYHEQSQQGRWTRSGWVNDSVTSPCIDAGDPAFDYAREQRPNGKRINLGAYGNTEQASMTLLPRGTIVTTW